MSARVWLCVWAWSSYCIQEACLFTPVLPTDVSCLYSFTAEVQMFPAVWAGPYQCVRVWYACHSVSVASYSQTCLTSAWFWLCSGTHRHTNADWPTVTLLLLKVRRHWPLLSSGRQYRLQMRHFPWSKRYLPTHTHTHYLSRQTDGWWHHQLPLQEWKINK